MGSGASKTAQSAVRKFPSRAPGSATPPHPRAARPPTVQRQPQRQPPKASFSKDEAVRADAMDPHMSDAMNAAFNSRLKQMGVAQPNPTYSPSSTANPMPYKSTMGPIFPSPTNNTTLSALEARKRLEREAKQELDNLGTSSSQGRQFLTVGMIKYALVLRDRGFKPEDIEQRLDLRPGVVRRLGPKGLVVPTGG